MRDQFWTYLCAFTNLYLIATMIVILLAVLSAISYPFAAAGSATRAIIQVNFILLGITFVITSGLFFTCARKEEQMKDYERY